MVRLPATAPLLVAAAMLAGCSDSTGPGDAAPGTATGQITGSVNRSFSGTATFGLASAFGTEAFGITIHDADEQIVVGVVLEEGGRPTMGSYPLGHLDTSPRYVEVGIGGSTWYESESGELRITSSSAQALQGTVSFTARRFGGQVQINVTATFNAMCIPGGWFTCD